MPAPTPFHKLQARQAFAQRLAQALHQGGRSASPSALAVEFNARFKGPRVHLSSCRKWLTGEAIPTQEKLVVLASMLGVTADWLRYGDETRVRRCPELSCRFELVDGNHYAAKRWSFCGRSARMSAVSWA